MSATFSPCGQYRYMLEHPGPTPCAIVGCNPSIAGRIVDGVEIPDPTKTKLVRMHRDWGYNGFYLGNTAAIVATDPRDMRKHAAPIGPDNDSYLQMLATLPLIVVAWGNDADPARARIVAGILRGFGAELYCLGVNANGSPKHPLYLSYATKLEPFTSY